MGSASSIIEKPQNGNLGSGLMSPESTPIDPISDQSSVKEVSDSENASGEKSDFPKGIGEKLKEKAVEEEEVKLRDTVEREIHHLTLEKAEIEAAWEKGPGLNRDCKEGNEIKTLKNESADEEKDVEYAVNDKNEAAREDGRGLNGDCKKGNEVKTTENENADEENEVESAVNENHDEEKDGRDVQNWKEEDRNEGYDENESSDEEEGERESVKVTVKGGGNSEFNTRRSQYRKRPDAKYCSFYMKTGSCKFGPGCKFNHPPRRKNKDIKERPKGGEGNLERAGRIECKDIKERLKGGEGNLERAGRIECKNIKERPKGGEGNRERPGRIECKDIKERPKGGEGNLEWAGRIECKDIKERPKGGEGNLERAGRIECKDIKERPKGGEGNLERAGRIECKDIKERPKGGEGNLERAGRIECKDIKDRPKRGEGNLERAGRIECKDIKDRPKGGEGNLERAGQIECKYYLTSGRCKYGKACKYYHGTGKSSISSPILEFNFLGLPIRPGETKCPYYMRHGSCKYGSNCRLHHPEPTAETGGEPPPGYSNGGSLPPQAFSSSSTISWSSPRALNETAPFVPSMLPTTQVLPSPNPEWNGYQAAPYPTSERSLPTPPAFPMNKVPTYTNFPIQHQQEMVIEDYPERPGEPECSSFLKTEDCKDKSNCKFRHPKKRISKPKANQCSLNEKGLPLRPDQPICTRYYRHGICTFGPGCKFNHPANFAISQPPYDRPPSNSQTPDGAGIITTKGNGSGSSM